MKVFNVIEKYLLYAFPAVLVCVFWSNAVPEKDIQMPLRILWEILAWNLLAWFALLTLFVISLLLVPSVRENFFRRIASIKERDEREEQLVGIVSKRTYISMLSVLVFLFFISAFSFQVRQVPDDQAINGKKKLASISLNLKLFDEARETKSEDGQTIIQSKDIPLTKSSLLLLLILLHLATYRVFFWSETRVA